MQHISHLLHGFQTSDSVGGVCCKLSIHQRRTMRQQEKCDAPLQRKMLFGKRIIQNNRNRFFTSTQNKKFGAEITRYLRSSRNHRSQNYRKVTLFPLQFSLQNRLLVSVFKTHFQTTGFLVRHIILGDPLSQAFPAARVGLSAHIFF